MLTNEVTPTQMIPRRTARQSGPISQLLRPLGRIRPQVFFVFFVILLALFTRVQEPLERVHETGVEFGVVAVVLNSSGANDNGLFLGHLGELVGHKHNFGRVRTINDVWRSPVFLGNVVELLSSCLSVATCSIGNLSDLGFGSNRSKLRLLLFKGSVSVDISGAIIEW
ncbi:hypothetical protein BKA91DRAFT_129544 [Yarrowia lipolytica]|nr:hypothetical protein BKA91DRAFT_129544 [Yarrowia lipolytica]KAE8171575.1 hypothetical protein BKA90DRAFT_129503 [Yarrowia lipolytica]